MQMQRAGVALPSEEEEAGALPYTREVPEGPAIVDSGHGITCKQVRE